MSYLVVRDRTTETQFQKLKMRSVSKMKFKRIIILMLSLSLLLPSFAMASDHGHEDHEGDNPEISTPASDLRAHLDHLLSEHFVLTVAFMQKAFDGKEDAGEAGAALNRNTEDLTAAIESVYGEEGGAEFERIWQSHINFFGDMVVATAEGDDEARQEAEENLEGYVVEFAAFLDAATEGQLPAEAGEENITGHVADVTNVFDSYVDGNFETSVEQVRHGIHHMFQIGEALSGAIVAQNPDAFDNTEVSTPASDLRTALNHLLSEHFAFAVLEMQKGFDGAEDFDAATWALDANTADLTAAIGSVYGEDGAEAFEPIWQSHINFFGDMVASAVEGDDEARQQAEENLEGYVVEFSAFLDAATEGRIPAEAGEQEIGSHVADVTNTFDAYAEEDYAGTYDEFRHGFHHMFMLSDILSGAFVDQMPEKFAASDMPEEMPQTGMGGASAGSGDSLAMMWVTMGALLALVTLVFIRKRATNEQ